MPQVSVIIPLYNKSKYIARTLDSIFAQTFGDFEVIVVDDGSTDEGPAIVEGYKDSRLKLIRQANAGPGAARNRGIRESSAPLLSFLDADDEWMPEFLEKTFICIRDNPDCAAVVAARFSNRDNPEHQIRQLQRQGFKEGLWRLPKGLGHKEMQRAVNLLGSIETLFHRTAVERFGGFYEHHCLHAEDWYLFIQIILNYTIYIKLEPLVYRDSLASELYVGRQRKGLPIPVVPMVTDPEPIRRNCPPEYRSQLEKWLASRALKSANYQIQFGNNDKAREILKRFPLVRNFCLRYIAIRMDLICSSLFCGWAPVSWMVKKICRFQAWYRKKKYSARW